MQGLMSVTDEQIAEAKRRYLRFLTPDLVDMLARFGDFNQRVFWSYLYLHAHEEIDREFVRRLTVAHRPMEVRPEDMSATPFRDAEQSLSSGRWFSGGIGRRLS